LIDGEGCISISKSKGGYFGLTVVIGMTSKALPALEMIHRRWGGSLRPRRKATDRWAEAWCWTICADSAELFLQEIGSLLILKAEQAELALEFMGLSSPRNTAAHRAAYQRMADLNRKGPTTTLPSAATAMCVGGRWWTPQSSLFAKTGWEPFSGPWATSGSIRNGIYSARPRSARPTFASDSSSWPTPDTGLSPHGHGRRGGGQNNGHQSGESLEATAAMWPTPNATAANDGEMPETWLIRQEELKAKGYNGNGAGMPLAIASQLWPTPRTITGGAESAERKQALGRTESGGGDLQAAIEMWQMPKAQDAKHATASPAEIARHDPTLAAQVHLWPTPNARDHKGQDMPGRHGGESLPQMLMSWPTPQAADGERATEWIGRREGNNPTLLGAVRRFPTPRAQDAADGPSNDPETWAKRSAAKHAVGIHLQKPLIVAVREHGLFSPPAPTTPRDGAPSSSARRTLNPLFVEALMGLPPGWTDSAALATPCSLWWRAMRSALSRLG
jgi:hypothetical protein